LGICDFFVGLKANSLTASQSCGQIGWSSVEQVFCETVSLLALLFKVNLPALVASVQFLVLLCLVLYYHNEIVGVHAVDKLC